MKRLLMTLPCVLVPALAQAAGPSGRDVMQKNAEATALPHVVSTSTLVVGAAGGDTHSKSFSLWRKAASDGVHYRTVTRFSAPAEIKGEAVLLDEKVNGRNDVLLYLPRYKKVRRVEAQAQKSSFMGSSFSYADMTTQAVDDYRHEVQKTTACPGESAQCFVVVSVPANDTVKENHGYAKRVSWIRTSDYQTIQSELYDTDGVLWKRVAYSNIREVDPQAHKALPFVVRVDDLKTKRFSTIQIDRLDAKTSVADDVFNEQSLSREI